MVSELCAAGVASLLVPLVVSTTAHQRDNAEWLAGQGGAILVSQSALTAQSLAAMIGAMTRVRALAMANRARALARPAAAARVADEIDLLVKAV
jgi:UDP-N-acetylglucosamine--N-acetylmuramyl-(pentapeptide) pyrophosphoryl-undecaprenol N-acetylglucosamine transferase